MHEHIENNSPTNSRLPERQGRTGNLSMRLGKFTNSRTFNVCLLFFLIASVFIVGQLLRARRSSVQVNFIERNRNAQNPNDHATDNKAATQEIFSGEVYDTAVRLRETGALGIAISLALFAETAETGALPANLEAVWASVQKRGLLLNFSSTNRQVNTFK